MGQRPDLTIQPPRRWMPIRFSEIWEFRDLLVRFAVRDVTLRYRQTALGIAWVVLQPLLAAGVFSFVFGKVAKLPSEGVPYFAFSYAGMIAWNLFSSTVSKFTGSLIGNAGLVSKIFFPRLVLPLSTLGSTLLDFLISLLVMAGVLAYADIAPTAAILLVPLWILITLGLAGGIGLTASALIVKYRDVGYVVPVMTQLLLYGTPIAYSLSQVPSSALVVVQLNPLTGAMVGIRWSLLGTAPPHAFPVLWSCACAVLLTLLGATIFSHMERQFADVI